jgi:hypothetical protein
VAIAGLLVLSACGGGTNNPAAVTPAIASIATQGTTLTGPSNAACGLWRFPNATAQSQYIVTFSNLPNPSDLEVAVDGQVLPKVSLSSPITGAAFQFDFSNPTTAKIQPLDATAFTLRLRNRSLNPSFQGTQAVSDAVVVDVRTGTSGGCGVSFGRDIPGGRIAFVSDRSGAREVWIMNGDPSWNGGVNLLKLSHGGVSEHPVIGPPLTYSSALTGTVREYKSNASVMYESSRSGGGDVYGAFVDGGNDGTWSTMPGADTEPSIRRDSGDVVWINGGDIWGYITPPGANPAATPLVRLTGPGNPTAGGNVESPVFSPAGDAIVFARGGKLRTIRPLAAPFTSTPLTNPAVFNNEKRHVFSRDGSKVAYIKDNKLFVIGAAGGADTLLSDPNLLADRPSFSPDGATIVFDAGIPGMPRQIYRVPAAGGAAPAPLTTQGSNVSPTFGPNGSIAFVSTRDGNSEIYVMDINGGSQRNLTNSPSADDQPHWR